MALTFIYGDRRAAFAVSLGTTAVRLGNWTLASSAELGNPDSSTLAIDDPTGNAGHSGDQILGLKTLVVTESLAGTNNTRIFTGYIGSREYESPPGTSLNTGAAVRITMDVTDLNTEATFHVITGADGKRPAETVGARLTWLLASSYIALTDTGYVVYPTNSMDANDYRNQTCLDVLNDCAQASGYNWFLVYDEAGSQVGLGFFNPNTSTLYSSTLRLSNVLADIDSSVKGGDGATHTWAPLAPKLHRSPETTASGGVMPYSKGTVYLTRPATAVTYGAVDRVMADANVKSEAVARARVGRFLWEASTERDTITCSVQLPRANVNDVREGQRISAKFRQLPGYKSAFSWFRVLHRSVGQADETDEFYQVDLTLSPQEAAEPTPTILQSSFQYGYADGLNPMALPSPVTIGSVLVFVGNQWKFGTPQPPNTDPGAGDGSTIGGTGAWTLLHATVSTAASGDRSGVAIWYKTATTTANYGNVFTSYSWGALYELTSVSFSGATVVAVDVPGASTNLDVGSLGSPASGKLAIMALAQYTGDIGAMTFTPVTGWTVDQQYTNIYWSSQRPWWVGHAVGTGAALEAKATSSASAPWCGVAVLLT